MSSFALWKKQALTKLDKSSIGGIDEKIVSLCNTINNRDDMFTLSSCSGRISLQKDTNGKKIENIWYYASHDEILFNDFLSKISKYNSIEDLIFIQESAILHICVENFDLGRNLMHIAKRCGFNQVGIIACKNKIVVEIISDSRLELPFYSKEILVNDEYIKLLLNRANKNLNKSWESINKLEKELK